MHRTIITLLVCCIPCFGAPVPVYKDVKPTDVQGRYELIWSHSGTGQVRLKDGIFCEHWQGLELRGTYTYDRFIGRIDVTWAATYIKNGQELPSETDAPPWSVTYDRGVWRGRTRYGGMIRMVKQKGG